MKKYKLELVWSLNFIIMMLLWMLLERLIGFHDVYIDKHAIFTNFILIPAIIVFYMALSQAKKQKYNNNMGYKQAFITGMVITIVVTLFAPITQWITSTIITPDYFNNVISYAVEKGYYGSQEEAAAYFNLKNYMIQAPVGALFLGTLISAVVAAFTKSKSS